MVVNFEYDLFSMMVANIIILLLCFNKERILNVN